MGSGFFLRVAIDEENQSQFTCVSGDGFSIRNLINFLCDILKKPQSFTICIYYLSLLFCIRAIAS